MLIPENSYTQKNMENTIKNNINIINEKKQFVSLLKPEFVKCNLINKELTIKFIVEEWELNPQNSLHGGITATIFDTTFGFLCKYFSNNNPITTISLTTNYLKPIWNGDIIKANTKIVSLGKNIINLTGEIFTNENDIISATSSASFMILKNKKCSH